MPKSPFQNKSLFRLWDKKKEKERALVDFTPVKAIEGKQIEDFSILPTFNSDRFFFTPAFIVPYDSYFDLDECLERHREKEQEKLEEMSNSDIVDGCLP